MRTLILSLALILPLASHAACKKSWVCDDDGDNCHTEQLCKSSIDLEDISLPGLKPMPTIDLKPLPSTRLAPLGTSQCSQRMVNGRWQNVCR